LLIKPLAFVPLWAFHISIQIATISDLGDALIICGFEVRHTSLKIYMDLMIAMTTPELIGMLVSSIIYRMSIIRR